MALTAIVDIDGTLVDTNYHHTLAWQRALRDCDVIVPAWAIHRHIGMGGDQIVKAIAGDDVEERLGDALRSREAERYAELIGEVVPLPGARDLLLELRRREHPIVLASSAKQEEVNAYLDLLDARDVVDDWTTSADVEATKPEPDLVLAALDKVEEGGDAVMLGDSVWDCIAAKRAGVPLLGVLSGGFGEAELREAGAREIYESPVDLLTQIDETPFGAVPVSRPSGIDRGSTMP